MAQHDEASGMQRWRGRTALVTGASSGIGEATARLLLRAGMRVAVCARRADRLQTLAASAADAELLVVPADLRVEAQLDALFATIREHWGGVDVLINNAGLGHHTSLIDGEPAKWREMLELNVLALCQCTRHAVSDMRGRGDDGHVVHISSLAAHRVPPGSGMYGATKFAVRALTESLRLELRDGGSNIRVSSISPGYVETEFHEVFYGDRERGLATYRRFKVLEASDVASAVEYVLAAPAHVQVHDVLLRSTPQPT